MGKLKQVARGAIELFCFGLTLPYEELFVKPKRKKQLDEEVQELREFFDTDDGLRTILEFYFRAETAKFDEPAGVYDPDTKKFEFFPVSEEKKRCYDLVTAKEKSSIDYVIALLEHDIATAGKNEDVKWYELLGEELKKYRDGADNGDKVAKYLGWYLSSSYVIKASKGIEMHIHPNKTRAYEHNGNKIVIQTKAGYSSADVERSQHTSLGLIQYKHDKDIIDLEIYHRIFGMKRKVCWYEISMRHEETVFRKVRKDGERRIPTPKWHLPDKDTFLEDNPNLSFLTTNI